MVYVVILYIYLVKVWWKEKKISSVKIDVDGKLVKYG